ncbi:MAG: fructose-specific PTS transporter subunit EIIC [Deferribacteraceae bacterium]|jgi:PTS system fructose-specific IIC component|nr:fructose-specific PTS transporter subunit EIIC [Deferribacteraceae bacterium]
MKKIVAITSCSTGIAHTYMAAEGLEVAAKELGWSIRVETQGSIGAENVLTEQEIKDADAVVIAASTTVNKDRFVGKKLIERDVNDAIQKGKELLESSLTANVYNPKGAAFAEKRAAAKSSKGIYAHLMTGVSYMIPFVVTGGICIALAFALGGINAEGEAAQAVNQLGGIAMGLMWPILGGYVAFSIADRPGLVPGMAFGMLAASMSAGFLGALAGGFLAGYLVLAIKKIELPKALRGLMPILIIPVFSVLIGGIIFKYLIGAPVSWLNGAMTDWLNSMSGTSGIILGLILGGMMAIDLAGPIGKAAYFFGVASLTNLGANETSQIMGAVMVSGMVPPLAMALSSTLIGKNRYNNDQRESGKSAWVLGLSFISEGAIPFAVADPVRVLGAVTVGSAITGALSMAFNCGIAVPHGGFFVFFIPGAVSNVMLYVLALAVGTVISGFLVTALKKPMEMA